MTVYQPYAPWTTTTGPTLYTTPPPAPSIEWDLQVLDDLLKATRRFLYDLNASDRERVAAYVADSYQVTIEWDEPTDLDED